MKKEITTDYIAVDLKKVLLFGDVMITELLDVEVASIKHLLLRRYGKAIYYSKQDVNIRIKTVYYKGIPSAIIDEASEITKLDKDKIKEYIIKYNIPKGVKVSLYVL